MSEAALDVQAEFAEPFLITPFSNGAEQDGDVNEIECCDPVRMQYPVNIIYHEEGKPYWPSSRGVSSNNAQKVVGAEIKLCILARDIPPDWTPRSGDIALRAKDLRSYRVSRSEPDDAGWIWLYVTAER